MRVLVVDDHTALRLVVKNLLDDPRIEVVDVENANQALAQLEESPFEIVFMDIRMPGMGGVEATRLIRSRWPDTAVFMLSSSDFEDDIKAARLAGAAGYIVKPPFPTTLRERLMVAMHDAMHAVEWKVHA